MTKYEEFIEGKKQSAIRRNKRPKNDLLRRLNAAHELQSSGTDTLDYPMKLRKAEYLIQI